MAEDKKPEPTSFAVVSWYAKDAPGKRYLQVMVVGPEASVDAVQQHFEALITSLGESEILDNPTVEDVQLLMRPTSGKVN